MRIAEDAWLATALGRPVFRVGWDGEGDEEAAAEAVRAHAAGHVAAMYDAKLPANAIGPARALCAIGFYPVDTALTLSRERDVAPPAAPPGVLVAECSPERASGALAIAASAFRHSRFHLDPAIPAETANEIKRRWVESYVRKERGDALLVAERGGRIAGFLAALVAERGEGPVAVIDLVAVAEPSRGSGAGRALVAAFAERYEGMPLEVGTQAANRPSVRFYERLGFSLERATMVLHMHASRESR